MPAIPNVTIRIGAEAGDALREIGKVNKALGEHATAGEKAHAAVTRAAAPAAIAFAAVGGAIIGATKAAAEDADAQAKLAGQLKRAGDATNAQVKGAESYIDKLSRQAAVADDELRPALGKLVQATGSVGEGQKQLAAATDIAANAHVPLAAAAKALAAADAGRYGALKKLVPSISDATLKTKDNARVIREAAADTAGAGAEAAQSYAGQQRAMSIAVDEATESIGAGFLPILSALMPVVAGVVGVLGEHTDAATVLIAVVGALSGAVLLVNAGLKAWNAASTLVTAATKVWTGAQWLLNAALDANPIGLVVIALAALAGAIYLAWQRSGTFRGVVREVSDALGDLIRWAITPAKAAWEGIKGALDDASGATDAVRKAVGLVVELYRTVAVAEFNLFRDAARFVYERLTDAASGAKALWDRAKDLAGYLRDTASGVLGGIRDRLGELWEKLKGASDYITDHAIGIFGKLLTPIEKVRDIVQSLVGWIAKIDFGLLEKAAGLAGKIGGAIGGLVGVSSVTSRPFVPLAGPAAAPAAPVTVNVYGAIDPEGTARTILRVLAAHDRRQGRTA